MIFEFDDILFLFLPLDLDAFKYCKFRHKVIFTFIKFYLIIIDASAITFTTP